MAVLERGAAARRNEKRDRRKASASLWCAVARFVFVIIIYLWWNASFFFKSSFFFLKDSKWPSTGPAGTSHWPYSAAGVSGKMLAPRRAQPEPALQACFPSHQQWPLQTLPGPLHPPVPCDCRAQGIWMSCHNTHHCPTAIISDCSPNKHLLNLGLQRRIFYKDGKQRLAGLSVVWQGARPSRRTATRLPVPCPGPGTMLPSPAMCWLPCAGIALFGLGPMKAWATPREIMQENCFWPSHSSTPGREAFWLSLVSGVPAALCKRWLYYS